MRNFAFGAFLIGFSIFASLPVSAQETEERVVDEVVAQVNDGVITLSRVNREIKALVDAEVAQGKQREIVEKELEEKKGELIANLINEELILQKAKELGVEREVDAQVNQRFLQVMRQYNLKTLDALFAEMRRTGVDPDDIRDLWSKQFTRDLVIQREVQSKEYWRPSGAELKAYFEKHKEKFTKPEQITLSEIFLSYAGRSEASVLAKANELVSQLRSGADFTKLVLENSDRPNKNETKGKVDTFNIRDLDTKIADAVKNVKVGGYSDPIEIDEVGITILRVDEKTAASNESHFDENAIRYAIMSEKFPEASRKFFATLREDSYIKISENWRPLVAPALFAADRSEKANN